MSNTNTSSTQDQSGFLNIKVNDDQLMNETINDIQNSDGLQCLIKVLNVLLSTTKTTLEIPFSNITLSPSEVLILRNIISNSPQNIRDIENCILDIVKDKTIDSSDIPKIIILFKNIYVLISSLKNVKNNTADFTINTSNILKFNIHLILQIYLLTDAKLISSCDALIDSCCELIHLQSTFQNKCTNVFGCWK
jgi:hypothetical protein